MNIKKTLDSMLSISPAELGVNYFESYLGDRRVFLNHEHLFSRLPVSLHKKCPKWLRDDDAFGPYEKSFLVNIFDSDKSFIPLRGGSGSGKSSLVSAICSGAADKCNSPDIDWPTKYGLRTFFSSISFQSAVDYSIDDDVTSDEASSRGGEFLSEIADQIIEHICYDIVSCSDVALFFSPLRERSEMPIWIRDFLTFLFQDRGNIFENNFDKEDLKGIFFDFLDSEVFDTGHKCFQFSIELLDFVARKVAEISKEFNLIICFDNTDRIHTEYLRKLYVSLNGVLEKPQFSNTPLRIVVFMRLSTANDSIGALQKGYVESIATPDPISVLIARLLNYLLRASERASPGDVETEYRIVEFLIRLLDPNDRLYELLISISGSNLRTLMFQSKKIISSENFQHRFGEAHNYEMHLELIKNCYSEDALVGIIEKLLEDSLGIIANNTSTELSEVKIICSSIEEKWFAVIESHSNASRHDGSHRGRIEKKLITEFLTRADTKSLVNSPLFVRLHQTYLMEIASQFRILFMGKSKEERRVFVDSLVRGVFEKRDARLETEIPSGTNRLYVTLMGILEQVFSDYFSNLLSSNSKKHRKISRPNDLYRQGLIKPGTNFYIQKQANFQFPQPKMTRHAVSRTLLEESTRSAAGGTYRPLNLFTISGDSYNPVMLDIIYVLGVKGLLAKRRIDVGNFTVAQIVENLQKMDHSDDQIITAFSMLTSTDRRLVYASVADFSDISRTNGLSKMMDREIFLSLAGARHFGLLLGNLDYLQWSLLKVARSLNAEVSAPPIIGGRPGPSDFLEGVYGDSLTVNPIGLVQNLNSVFRALTNASYKRIDNSSELVCEEVPKEYKSSWIKHRYPDIDIFFRVTESISELLRYSLSTNMYTLDSKLAKILLSEILKESNSFIDLVKNENSIDILDDWEATTSRTLRLVSAIEETT